MSSIKFTEDGEFTYHILMDEKIINNEIKYLYSIWTNGKPLEEHGKKWTTEKYDEAKLIMYQHKHQQILNLMRTLRKKIHEIDTECNRVKFQIHFHKKKLGLTKS